MRVGENLTFICFGPQSGRREGGGRHRPIILNVSPSNVGPALLLEIVYLQLNSSEFSISICISC